MEAKTGVWNHAQDAKSTAATSTGFQTLAISLSIRGWLELIPPILILEHFAGGLLLGHWILLLLENHSLLGFASHRACSGTRPNDSRPTMSMTPAFTDTGPPAPVALVLQQMDEAVVEKDHLPVTTLFKRFGIDVVAAAAASFGVSPFITIVDRAIAENASGRRTLAHGVRELSKSFVTHPLQFCKSREFMWIFGLYTATYATANSIESAYEWKQEDGSMPKLAGTTLVNMTSVIAKDRAFAQMFGVVKAHPFPMASIGLFAVRDSLTVISCFHAPKVITEKFKDYGINETATSVIAQIGAPIAVQILSTPLHLLGLDLYNHPVADTAARIQFIRREYFRSALARIARIGPAFGIGGIGNKSVRSRLREMTE